MLRDSVIIGASVNVGASVIMELCLFSSRLHKEETRLKPSLSAFQFHHLLFNLTAIQISNAGGHNCKCVCVCVCLHACMCVRAGVYKCVCIHAMATPQASVLSIICASCTLSLRVCSYLTKVKQLHQKSHWAGCGSSLSCQFINGQQSASYYLLSTCCPLIGSASSGTSLRRICMVTPLGLVNISCQVISLAGEVQYQNSISLSNTASVTLIWTTCTHVRTHTYTLFIVYTHNHFETIKCNRGTHAHFHYQLRPTLYRWVFNTCLLSLKHRVVPNS